MYASTEPGSIRNYRMDSIDEKKLGYEVIKNISMETNNGYDTTLNIKIISMESKTIVQ